MKDISRKDYYAILRTLFIAFILVFLSALSYSQAFMGSWDENQILGKYGTFSNGISYFITPDSSVTDHIRIKMFVDVGSMHEEKGENELAHFLEHMAFVSGKNITRKKLFQDKALQKIGLKPHAFRGHTTVDKTIYEVVIESGNELAFDKALLFLKDVLKNLEFKQEDINAEKSPFLQEHYSGIRKEVYIENLMRAKISGFGQPYPSDFKTHIESFSVGKLAKFYNRWYTPKNTTIMITGDIQNMDIIFEGVKEYFDSPLMKDRVPLNWRGQSRYLNTASKFILLSDSLRNDRLDLNFFYRKDSSDLKNSAAITENRIVEKLISIFNKRIANSLNKQLTELKCRLESELWPPSLMLNIKASEELLEKRTKLILGMLSSFKKFGLTDNEYDELLNQLLKDTSFQITDVFERLGIDGLMLYNQNEGLNSNSFTKNDINKIIKRRFEINPDDIGLIYPQHLNSKLYTEQLIRSWVKEIKDSEVEKYEPHLISNTLLSDAIERELLPVQILNDTTSIPGAQSFILENGVRLLFKPFKPNQKGFNNSDQILVHGFSREGALDLSDSLYYVALCADEIARNSGLGNIEKYEYDQFKDAKYPKLSVVPYISSDHSGIRGKTLITEPEVLFQAMYLYLSKMNFKEKTFEDWKQEVLSDTNDSEFKRFIRLIKSYLGHPEESVSSISERELELLNFKSIEHVYESIFQTPENFTFLFTGDFNTNDLLPLAQKYLGNIPQKGIRSIKKPSGRSNVLALKSGQEFEFPTKKKSSQVWLEFQTHIALNDFSKELYYKLLSRSIKEKLYNGLRVNSTKGGVYGVFVSSIRDVYNYKTNRLIIKFSCNQEDRLRLINRTKTILQEFREMGLNEIDFLKYQKQLDYLKSIPDNLQMLDKLYAHEYYGMPFRSAFDIRKIISSMSLKVMNEIIVKEFKDPIIFYTTNK